MEVILAKTAGFCFGVKRAVDTVYKEAGKKNVYTYGPIIHNSEVVNDLKKKGVEVINSREELEALEEGTVIIRSHGVAREIYDLIHEKGLELVDATCPFVRKIHKIVEKAGNDGDQVIIVGSEHHPEVQGIKGWCTGEVHIISDAEQFEGIDLNKPTTLVSQTTFNYKKFQDLVEILNKKGYDIGVCNTICNATEERQLEAKSIAKGVDAMVVIGDKQSSNSQKLYEISKKECENTFFVQTLRDLDLKLFESTGKVGITAGASTPQKIIKEVHASMTEKSFEELLEESFVTIHNGEVVKGTVIDVKPDEIILNIGYKADGILTRSEYSNDSANVDLTTVAKVGDTMETKVLKVNDGEGQVLLTYKRLAAEKGNKRLEEAFENKEVLKAPVAQVLDGGLSVLIEEARVFIPASLVSDSYERDLKFEQKSEGTEKDVGLFARRVQNSYQKLLQENFRILDEEQVRRVAGMLNISKRVLIFGIGNSGYAAEEFQLRFMRIGMDVNAVTDSHMMKIGAALAGEETLVIAITLSGETAEVLESIRIAKSRGASIICMTAVSGSSVAKESQEVIQVAALKNLDTGTKISPQFSILAIMDVLYSYYFANDSYFKTQKYKATLSAIRAKGEHTEDKDE